MLANSMHKITTPTKLVFPAGAVHVPEQLSVIIIIIIIIIMVSQHIQ